MLYYHKIFLSIYDSSVHDVFIVCVLENQLIIFQKPTCSASQNVLTTLLLLRIKTFFFVQKNLKCEKNRQYVGWREPATNCTVGKKKTSTLLYFHFYYLDRLPPTGSSQHGRHQAVWPSSCPLARRQREEHRPRLLSSSLVAAAWL